MRPSVSHIAASILLLGFAFAIPERVLAQDPSPTPSMDNERFRIGITVGGTGLVGLVGEYQWGDWSAEILLGTISFRDLSIAAAGKRYFGDGKLRPAAGLGVWSLSVWSEEGNGSAFLLRAPLAVDWAVSGGHALGVEIGLNRALWVNRLDPEDDRPPRASIVPFPGLYYKVSAES